MFCTGSWSPSRVLGHAGALEEATWGCSHLQGCHPAGMGFSQGQGQNSNTPLPSQGGEQARIRSGGTEAAQLLLRCGQLSAPRLSVAACEQKGSRRETWPSVSILSLHLPWPGRRTDLGGTCPWLLLPRPVLKSSLCTANPCQKSLRKKDAHPDLSTDRNAACGFHGGVFPGSVSRVPMCLPALWPCTSCEVVASPTQVLAVAQRL